MARSHAKISRGSPRIAPEGGLRIFRVLSREAVNIRHSSTGDVGLLYSGEGIEVVWVSKAAEKIDRRWFRYPPTDLIMVVRGWLRVEFRGKERSPRTLGPGDFLVLPPRTPCRAYRWPRSTAKPTVFVAVYPVLRTVKQRGNSRGPVAH
jgi:hypothetical protein